MTVLVLKFPIMFKRQDKDLKLNSNEIIVLVTNRGLSNQFKIIEDK